MPIQLSKKCGSRKYPFLPHGWLLEIPRGLGVSKAKKFKGKYEALTTGISRGVVVVQSKEPPMGEV